MFELIIFIFAVFIVIYLLKFKVSGIITKNCSKLDLNATIVSVHSEPDNWGKYKHFKTIVTFSDGSEYHTHYAKEEPALFGRRIFIDAEVVDEIIKRAKIAHDKKVNE